MGASVTPPRIKVCCIGSVEEARMAVEAGVSAIGLVSSMPSGPGPIPEELIAEIADSVPPGVSTFLLTCLQDVDAIIEQRRRCRTNTVQIVDRLENGTHADLRRAMPGIGIVQVIHVSGPASLEEARQAAPHVHALLLDSGNPTLEIKELGGTGRVHDWEISRRIRFSVDIPVYLAGGLTISNVLDAIRLVEPFGLDICSSIRTNGQLDPGKLWDFTNLIRLAPQELV